MSGRDVIAGAIQLGGVLVVAPLLPGIVQSSKARLQGRRGASPLQPYRELRRLFGKSAVDPEGSGPIYRNAPAVVAATLVLAGLLVPVAGRAPGWPVGHDALVLVGLLALGRFAITVAAWDTGNGFALQGASRDLAISVSVEVALVLALACAALAGGTTDLRGMAHDSAGSSVWTSPAQALALLAFLLVVVAETGRQPVDNPDTHLELTMIHEGPLLEYAGRDLACLQWAMAARHWLVFGLAAAIFLPHPSGFVAGLLLLPIALVVLALALALGETLIAKVRILLVPRLLGAGAGLALLGVIIRLVETRP
jgi:formate hydrogenlyase subunit 4